MGKKGEQKKNKALPPKGVALEGDSEDKREQASLGWDTKKISLQTVLIVGIFAIMALQIGGVIDIGGLLNPDSGNYLDLGHVLNPDNGGAISGTQCFEYSWQMEDTVCCTVNKETGVGVAGVLAMPGCDCPLDTTPAAENLIGGEIYWMCTCNACPG